MNDTSAMMPNSNLNISTNISASNDESLPKGKLAIFVSSSKNEKVGKVAATYASIAGSCPKTCSHYNNGCYAQTGMVSIHVNRLDKAAKSQSIRDAREVAREEARLILAAIARGENKLPMRLHVSGDARTPSAVSTLSKATRNWGKPIWTYTHAWKNVSRDTWGQHISVLASVDASEDIPLAYERGYAAAITVSSHPSDGKAFYREDGYKVIPCPAQTRDTKCDSCRLCWNADKLHEQKAMISFAAHGVRKKVLRVIG